MSKRFVPYLGLALALLLAVVAYRPGLDGPFLFDDFANLPALGATGPVDNVSTLARYLTSGTADPTGRPVALLSFLVDARDWPADPYPFKRTNLCLHLLNGLLLFALLRRLLRWRGDVGVADDWAALFASACWLLHPLFVSTTLYIVQREAILPATFTLIGLWCWTVARDAMAAAHTRRAVLGWLGLALCTAVATLSKANGILLPAFVLVLEYTVARAWQPMPEAARARYGRAVLVFGWVPALLVAAALLALGAKGLIGGIGETRPWTLSQRLLTEPRILWDYLRLLWLPRPFTAGVFNDQFAASSDALHPWTTPFAMLGIAGLVALAVRWRRSAPVVSAALLFFLVGQVVESTTIPLELYFEHRNYVPALLMFWPPGLWLARHVAQRTSLVPSRTVAIGLCAVATLVPVGLAFMTHDNARVWGSSSEQAQLWARLNPASPRAQVLAAQDDISSGRAASAIARLQPMLDARPDEVQLALNLIAARCGNDTLTAADFDRAEHSMRISRDSGTLLVSWFVRAIGEAQRQACAGLTLERLGELAASGLDNPRLSAGRRQDLAHIAGALALTRNEGTAALAAFDKALAYDPNEGIALQQAAMLGSAGYPALGLAHLRTADTLVTAHPPAAGMPRIHAWVLARQDYWTRERRHLEQTLQHDAAADNNS